MERSVGKVEEGAKRGRDLVGHGARVVTNISACRRQKTLWVLHLFRDIGFLAAFFLASPPV